MQIAQGTFCRWWVQGPRLFPTVLTACSVGSRFIYLTLCMSLSSVPESPEAALAVWVDLNPTCLRHPSNIQWPQIQPCSPIQPQKGQEMLADRGDISLNTSSLYHILVPIYCYDKKKTWDGHCFISIFVHIVFLRTHYLKWIWGQRMNFAVLPLLGSCIKSFRPSKYYCNNFSMSFQS